MMKTRDMSTWSVGLKSVSILDKDFDFDNEETYVIYEPSLPFMYLPEKDFMKFMAYASTFFSIAGEDKDT